MKDEFSMRNSAAGVTLIEMLTALVVLIVLAATAVPLVTDMREKQRITAATEAVNAQISLAKSETGKRSDTIYVSIEDGSNWAVGVSNVTDCDPEGGGTDCTLNYVESTGTVVTKVHAIQGTDYPGTTIANSSPDEIAFYPVRGTASGGTVVIQSDDYESRVEVSAFGRIRVCSPAGGSKIGRYPDC